MARHRPRPSGLHLNYNSWWTAPSPFYRERDILAIMAQFATNLHELHGLSLDTFCIDMGWANPRSVWEIERTLFPAGFANLRAPGWWPGWKHACAGGASGVGRWSI